MFIHVSPLCDYTFAITASWFTTQDKESLRQTTSSAGDYRHVGYSHRLHVAICNIVTSDSPLILLTHHAAKLLASHCNDALNLPPAALMLSTYPPPPFPVSVLKRPHM